MMKVLREPSRLIAILVVLAPCASATQGRYAVEFCQAYQALSESSLEEAKVHFLTAMEFSPENPNAAYYLACVASRAGNVDEGLLWLDRAGSWGYWKADIAESDHDLDGVREDGRFQAALAAIRENAEEGLGTKPTSTVPRRSYSLKAKDLRLSPRMPVALAGDRLAIPLDDGSIRIAAVDDGTVEAVLRGHRRAVRRLARSANGRLLASASDDGTLCIWRLADFSMVDSFEASASPWPKRPSLAFAPRGERLLGWGLGEGVYIWDSSGLRRLLGSSGERPGVGSACWGGEGGVIGTGGGYTRIWDAGTGGVVATFRNEPDARCVAFHPQGRYLAFGMENQAIVWDLQDNTVHKTLEHYPGAFGVAVNYVEFSPDGQFLVTTTDWGEVRWWDWNRGDQEWFLDYRGGNPGTLRARIAGDGNRVLISGQTARTPRIVDARNGRTILDLAYFNLDDLAETEDGGLTIGTAGSAFYVFDGPSLREMYERFDWSDDEFIAVAPSGDYYGTLTASDRLHILVRTGKREFYPIHCFASVLLDPKGLSLVSSSRLKQLPEPPRIVALSGNGPLSETVVEAVASHSQRLRGFEVLFDGEAVPPATVDEATSLGDGARSARMRLVMGLVPGCRVTVSAVSTDGILGLPRTLRFD